MIILYLKIIVLIVLIKGNYLIIFYLFKFNFILIFLFNRYEQFDQDLYLIAFFLHPQFKGIDIYLLLYFYIILILIY